MTTTQREGMSPKDFAAAIGVSESSVKRWVDQGLVRAIRTAGGHRRIAPDEAARWIREHRVQPSRPDRNPQVVEPSSGTEALRPHVEPFYEHIYAGRSLEARSMALRLFVAGHSIAELSDTLIAPAMARIGALWLHSAEGIFIEHRATDIAMHIVKELDGASADQHPRQKAPAAVSAALVGDFHALPPMLAAATVGEVGYRPTNLGSITPMSILEMAVEKLDARLVCLSLSVSPDPAVVVEVTTVVQRLRARDVRVAVGGRHVDSLGFLSTADGLHIGMSMGTLATFARSALDSGR